MRLPLWERPVSYAAVGATQAEDLLRYPPAGYRPVERRVRIGHGDARWEHAWTGALSWAIQRGSGMRVELHDSPREVTDLTYTPVGFDDEGNPARPSTVDDEGESLFAPNGEPFLKPGDTATLRIPFGPLHVSAPVRVVYVVDEPAKKGFAYGTLPGHPESGEECWIIERTEDGSVWMTIRAFSRPSHWAWWLIYPVLRFAQELYTRRYERSLSGSIAGSTEG